jgi:hypothetical protein
MGRPPIGKRAMTALERLHRHRAKLRARKGETKPETKHETKSETKPARSGALARAHARTVEFGEVGRLRAENNRLRARIKVLTPTLDGETIKLRKEVEGLRGERHALKQALRQAAKERDRNAIVRSSPLLRAAARGDLKRANYHKIIACLHRDTRASKSETQRDEAAALFTTLNKLFQFES